jgi:hypothetical protein
VAVPVRLETGGVVSERTLALRLKRKCRSGTFNGVVPAALRLHLIAGANESRLGPASRGWMSKGVAYPFKPDFAVPVALYRDRVPGACEHRRRPAISAHFRCPRRRHCRVQRLRRGKP